MIRRAWRVAPYLARGCAMAGAGIGRGAWRGMHEPDADEISRGVAGQHRAGIVLAMRIGEFKKCTHGIHDERKG